MDIQNLLNPEQVDNALELLTEIDLNYKNDLAKYNTTKDVENSDDDGESGAPYYDSFYCRGGAKTIMSLTNFTDKEFQNIFNCFEPHISASWNIGRGKKYETKPKDILFMCLTTLKHGGQWDLLGRIFRINGNTFERMITKFIHMLCVGMYKTYVQEVLFEWPFSKIVDQNKNFKYFKFARYATDVIFHQSNRPSGNKQEAKKYFSGKHKLYGYKTEVSVLPNGMAINFSEHYPGSKADKEIFVENILFHKKALKKKEEEKTKYGDVGELIEEYENSWAVLLDKGYQGITEKLRGIHPSKNPQHGFLSAAEQNRNRKIATDRIIVENYFGRMTTLWTLFGKKYRWCEENYDTFFSFALALTNIHIKWNPLRAEDGERYNQLISRLYFIGESLSSKRKEAQRRYREKKRRRLDAKFGHVDVDDETVEP